MMLEPGCLAKFIGCKLKGGGALAPCEVIVGHGPWNWHEPCLHCGSQNLVWAVDGLPNNAGCCQCRLIRIDGCDHKFVDSTNCVKCGRSVRELEAEECA